MGVRVDFCHNRVAQAAVTVSGRAVLKRGINEGVCAPPGDSWRKQKARHRCRAPVPSLGPCLVVDVALGLWWIYGANAGHGWPASHTVARGACTPG
jgi:hypothetical protein